MKDKINTLPAKCHVCEFWLPGTGCTKINDKQRPKYCLEGMRLFVAILKEMLKSVK